MFRDLLFLTQPENTAPGLALEKLGEILENLRLHPDDIIISNKLGWLRDAFNSSRTDI